MFAYYILKWVLMQHMDEVVLASDHAITKWFDWWRAASPTLDQMAAASSTSEHQSLRMGMTCQH